jgi:hypothetical protein
VDKASARRFTVDKGELGKQELEWFHRIEELGVVLNFWHPQVRGKLEHYFSRLLDNLVALRQNGVLASAAA